MIIDSLLDNQLYVKKLAKDLDYYKRLESYFPRWTDHTKPAHITPMLCASRGWVCIDTDMLRCVECSQFLSASIPAAYQFDNRQFIAKEGQCLFVNILEAHSDQCSWRSAHTPESDMRPGIDERQEVESHMRNRIELVRNLTPLSPLSLPFVDFDELQFTDEDLQKVVAHFHADDIDRPLLICAIIGWEYKFTVKNKHIFQCKYCMRNMCPSALSAMRKYVDPVGAHMFWCPWRCPPVNTTALPLGLEQTKLPRYVVALHVLFASEETADDLQLEARVTDVRTRLDEELRSAKVAEAIPVHDMIIVADIDMSSSEMLDKKLEHLPVNFLNESGEQQQTSDENINTQENGSHHELQTNNIDKEQIGEEESNIIKEDTEGNQTENSLIDASPHIQTSVASIPTTESSSNQIPLFGTSKPADSPATSMSEKEHTDITEKN